MTKAEKKRHFIDWFLSIPDVDETLVDEHAQNADGFFDETVNALWSGYKAGVDTGEAFGSI